jgi:hypothetical protein
VLFVAFTNEIKFDKCMMLDCIALFGIAWNMDDYSLLNFGLFMSAVFFDMIAVLDSAIFGFMPYHFFCFCFVSIVYLWFSCLNCLIS